MEAFCCVMECVLSSSMSKANDSWSWEVRYHVSPPREMSDGRSCVIDEITRRMVGHSASMGYVYFDYSNSKNQIVDNVIRSLLVQILFGQSAVPREIEDMHDEYSRRSTMPNKATLKRHLFSLLSLSTSFVLFDALDELSPENVTAVTDLVREITDSGVRVFCTGNTMSVRTKLGEPTVVEIRAHDDDMINYLTTQLNKEWEYDSEFKPEIVQTLVEKAAGKSIPPKHNLIVVFCW